MSAVMRNRIQDQIKQLITIKQVILKDQKIIEQITRLVEVCLNLLRVGGKIIFAGNEGNFPDVQHLSAEFTSRLMFDRTPLSSVGMGTNNSTFSAVGNDFGYDQVFSRELAGIGKLEHVFIQITTSGNSRNVLAAAEITEGLAILTIGITGQTGGALASYVTA